MVLALMVDWAFILMYGLLGVSSVAFTAIERRFITALTHPRKVRMFGTALVALALMLFFFKEGAGWKDLFFEAMVLAHVLAGGVNLLLPEPMIVLNEAWLAKGNTPHRLLGIVYIGVALLFYIARPAEYAVW